MSVTDNPISKHEKPLETIVNEGKRPDFFKRHFSGRHFKVQLASGIVSTTARALVSLFVYNSTNNLEMTIFATQAASGVGYVGSYSLLFFPIANRDKYKSYLESVKSSFGFQGLEQIPNIFTYPFAYGTQFGAMKLGLDPVTSAILSSWSVNKLVNIFVGIGSSNFVYKHGGMEVVKGAINRVKAATSVKAVQAAYVQAACFTGTMGQYLPK